MARLPQQIAAATKLLIYDFSLRGMVMAIVAVSLAAISAGGDRFSDEKAHPGVIARFRKPFKAVLEMPCAMLMTPHAGASGLLARRGPVGTVTADGELVVCESEHRLVPTD